MAGKKVILVTGVAGYWGYRLAKKLIEKETYHVIGVDDDKPDPEIKDLDFIQADVRNPLLVELLKSENVETVCHLVFSESLRPNESAFDINVMGSIKVFGACVEAGVKKIVLKSSTMVYGARPTNPGFLTEESPLRGSRKYGYIRDLVEIEAFCNGFRRQHPHMSLTILRFPHIIGPTVDTPLTRFLTDPVSPMLLGFDPMVQIIHEKDVIDALVHAIEHDHPGVFNVAAEGIMPLMRLISQAGKFPIPVFHLFAYWGIGILGSAIQRKLPIDPDYLRYRWVADLTKMREELRFLPKYTAQEAIREFSGEQRTRAYMPDAAALAFDQDRLRDTIERRRRERAAINPEITPTKARAGRKKS